MPRMQRNPVIARKIKRIMASAHRGASNDRLHSDFVTSAGSADADNLYELPTLRQRCRDLIRNDGYAKSALMTLVSHVVGTGFKPQSILDSEELGLDPDAAGKLQRRMERIYERWAEHADITRRLDADGLQRLFYRQKIENGEGLALIRMKERPRVRYRLCVQLVEADRLGDGNLPAPLGNIRSGVELDEDGSPKAYHIRKTHPGDYFLSNVSGDPSAYERIPALNEFGWPLVLHHYSVDRPGQTRGIPLFGPVITLFKDLMDYREAEITAARAAACYMMMIKRNDPLGGANADATLPDGESAETNDQGQRLQGFEPGMIAYLGLNEEMQSFSPNRPSNTFDPFIRSCLRIIAAATGQTYEQVSHDLSQVNYSSIRAGNLESKRFYSMEQADLIRGFPRPLWGMLMEEAYLLGELDARDFLVFPDEWTRTKWDTKLGEEWIDPLKEVTAIEKALNLNLTTHAAEIAKRTGGDWEAVFDQRGREVAKQRELEILPAEAAGVALIDTSQGEEVKKDEGANDGA